MATRQGFALNIDSLLMVQGQAAGHSGASIVRQYIKLSKTKVAHDFDLIQSDSKSGKSGFMSE